MARIVLLFDDSELDGSELDLVFPQPARLPLSPFFRKGDDRVRQVKEQTTSQLFLHTMIFCKLLDGQGFFCGRPLGSIEKLQWTENDLAWM
jgi:hypothetical protein